LQLLNEAGGERKNERENATHNPHSFAQAITAGDLGKRPRNFSERLITHASPDGLRSSIFAGLVAVSSKKMV